MTHKSRKYDVEIIRPQLKNSDVHLRGRDFTTPRRKKIKQALRTLHTLEAMAATIYKFQITSEPTELNRQLCAAMLNEMTHHQDFQNKLYEYGFRPSLFRWVYLIVGFIFGFGSRLLGRKMVLKTGIWVESQAVTHYAELLGDVDWDEDTRKIVEKDQADEDGHIDRWREFLEHGG